MKSVSSLPEKIGKLKAAFKNSEIEENNRDG